MKLSALRAAVRRHRKDKHGLMQPRDIGVVAKHAEVMLEILEYLEAVGGGEVPLMSIRKDARDLVKQFQEIE